jgi:hypothetical protein
MGKIASTYVGDKPEIGFATCDGSTEKKDCQLMGR